MRSGHKQPNASAERTPNRSLRIEYSAINTVAFKSCSGGTLGRPIREYIASNSLSSSARTSSMTLRIRRIG
jgi:hypothetical protein